MCTEKLLNLQKSDIIMAETEEHDIEGTRIVIIDNCPGYGSSEKKEKVKLGILATCKAVKKIKLFPELIFSLDTGNEGGHAAAWVDSREYHRGKVMIHIGYQYFEKMLVSDIVISTYLALLHEINHLWHEQASQAIRIKHEHCGRLRKAIFKHTNKESIRYVPLLREYLGSFFHNVYIEGMAHYASLFETEMISFSEKDFNKHYEKASAKAQLFFKYYQNDFISSLGNQPADEDNLRETFKTLIGMLNSIAGEIGSHMIYTILYVDHTLDLDKLSKFRQLRFTRKYVECIISQGKRPVVSINRNGIIDYSTLLRHFKTLRHLE